MSTRVKFNAASAFGQQVAEYVGSLVEARDKGRRIRAAFDSMAAGGSYATIETELGGMTAGEGQTLYNLVTGSVSALEKPAFDELSRIDQG